MSNDSVLPRWIAPDSSIILLCECEDIRFDTGLDVLTIVGRKEDKEFSLGDDVSQTEIDTLLANWHEYLESLVSKKPFPGSTDATGLGCQCLKNTAHDPNCPVVTEAKEPTPVEASLTDILADLVHRLMEQNVSLDQLTKLLTPAETLDPLYVPIPGFESMADRNPTDIERMCFLAGVVRFAVSIPVNIHVTAHLEKFFDRLNVPTIKCTLCNKRVPLERAVPVEEMGYIGADCCYDNADGSKD